MPPPIHDEPPEPTAVPSLWREEETPMHLVERGALIVAFGAGLLAAMRKGTVALYLLGWGATAVITWGVSKQ